LLVEKFEKLELKIESFQKTLSKDSKKNGSQSSLTDLKSFRYSIVSKDEFTNIVSVISDDDERFIKVRSLVFQFAETMKLRLEAGNIDEVKFVQPDVFLYLNQFLVLLNIQSMQKTSVLLTMLRILLQNTSNIQQLL
jgi:hypothetical protein